MLYSLSSCPYVAIIGDIVNSRQFLDRNELQIQLNRTLEVINIKYKKDIVANFLITLGDEFQGLLRHGDKAIDIIQEIQNRMYPVEIRIGIGVGKITTDIIAERAIGADGPGYYKAREAIEFLKSSEKKNRRVVSDVRIDIEGEDNSISEMLNTIFSLLTMIKRNWTTRQREIIEDYESYSDGQQRCADRFGITQSSVQRALISGNYYTYKQALDTVKRVLRNIGRTNV